jgi:protein Xni
MGIRLLVVDALNVIRRVYAATPERDDAKSSQAALEATVQSLHRAVRETGPTHGVSVFDGQEPTWRHRLYADYKAGRKPMPPALKRDLERYREAFLKVGLRSIDKPDLEADDVIATLATKVSARGGSTVILSTDTVFCQLLSDKIDVRDHFNKRNLDRAYVRQKWAVEPERLVDLWALAGSQTTHIPGVPMVGPKTAARLLEEHGTLEAVLKAAEGLGGNLGKSLRLNSEEARMSRELARLRQDLSLGWNLKSFRLP